MDIESPTQQPTNESSRDIAITDNPAIKSLIRSNTRLFEQYLLAAMVLSYDFWRVYCKDRVNAKIGTYRAYEDFSKSIHNNIYDGIVVFYNALGDKSSEVAENECRTDTGVDLNFVMGLLRDQMYLGKLSIEDVKFAEESLSDIRKLISDSLDNKEVIFSFAKSGLAFWLELRRVAQITTNTYNSKITAEELITKIKSATDGLSVEDSTCMSFEDAVDFEDTDNGGYRMPVATLPIFTRVLAGGLKKGETGIVASLPSGGKTVFACQLAVGLALNAFKVLFISTEQHAVNLVPRCVSLSTNIPFDLINDGIRHAINNNKLSKQQISEIKEFTQLVKPYLYFENWGLKGNKITSSLEHAIDSFVELNGGLDVVIIDWIGGGIEKPPEEKAKKNEYYDYTMKYICKVMKQKHLAGVVMAQVNPKQAENIAMITITELADCKTLDQDASWALGISRLENPKTRVSNQIQASYKSQQTFNFWKNRLSPPYHYPVIRDFAYQRFVEKEQASPMSNVMTKVELASVDSLNIKRT
jgi:archaellum biogenesis ATPase FlaH